MLSMTGYGKGEYKEGGIELTCEIKTVNNRYLDVSLKMPRIFTAYEEIIRSLIRGKLTRGHADVFVSFKDKREKPTSLTADLALATAYVNAAKAIKERFPELVDDVTVSNVLRYPEVLRQDEVASADEELINALKTAVSMALDKLNEMRSVEGEKLKADMLSRMTTIEGLVKEVSLRAPQVAQEHKQKLLTRVREYLDGVNPDESRLLTEVAVFTDKSNIDEELTRLYSHIAQFRDICEEGIVGRKLDFLVQEKLAAKDATIADLRMQVSQSAQNNYFAATIDAAKAELIRRTGHDYPVASYLVQPPTPINFPLNGCGTVQFGNTCGYNACNGYTT